MSHASPSIHAQQMPASVGPSDRAGLDATGLNPAGMNPAEMSSLLEAFNTVAMRLQATHEALTSEVVRLRRELREANEAVERSRRLAALGEMAAGIAHEVRNPLGSIRLYAKMLEEDLAQQPLQAGLACKITSATRTVEAIVGDVLSFAREIKVRHEKVQAKRVLDGALEHLTHASVVGAQSVRIVRDERAEEATTLWCDGGLLSQALANIVRNAMEAMHEHHAPVRELHIDARAAKLSFGSGKRVQACVISVMDSGPGIAPEVVERMFNPFFTTRQHGTGLGLAIVHRIIDAHGGRVIVRNNVDAGLPGPGACVSIVLPAMPVSKEHDDEQHDADVVVKHAEQQSEASRALPQSTRKTKAPRSRKTSGAT
jgi:signal transduction histidine kinase